MRKFKSRLLSVLLIMALLAGIPSSALAVSITDFEDVPQTHWAYDMIDSVVQEGLMVGTSDTRFEPNITISRAMFVAILANMSGETLNNNTSTPFTDVPANAWYRGALAWAFEESVVAGISSTEFAPDEAVTREQMAVLVVNYAQWAGIELPEAVEVSNFTDYSQISQWAVSAVVKCQKAGIIVGVGNGKFEPRRSSTRAEAAAIFVNVLEVIRYQEIPILSIESDIYGEAFINGYSTLKVEEGREVEYDPDTSAVLTISLPDGAAVDDSKIDSSNASVSLSDGDGYYVSEFVFNATTLSEAWSNGQTEYTLSTGDLEWDNSGYSVDNGGREWSGIGGNGNGHYEFNLEVSGITYNGKEVPAQTFRIHIYIYGREFSGGINGAAGYDNLVLPTAELSSLDHPPTVTDEPVWTWIGDGEKPIVCDYLTDDFYITWPVSVDASELTDSDITITMHSQYGDEYELAAGDEFEVQSRSSETQIALTLVYWPFTPVYNTMTIKVDSSNLSGVETLENISRTYDIASVYTHMVQTGGGMDRDLTVVGYNFYGLENLTSTDQVVQSVTYTYRNDENQYYAEDADGNGYLTSSASEAKVYDGNGEDDRNLKLVGNVVFITARVNNTEELNVNGIDYTFTKVYSGGRVSAPASDLKVSPGYVMTTSSGWDTHQRWAWLFINSEGWLKDS